MLFAMPVEISTIASNAEKANEYVALCNTIMEDDNCTETCDTECDRKEERPRLEKQMKAIDEEAQDTQKQTQECRRNLARSHAICGDDDTRLRPPRESKPTLLKPASLDSSGANLTFFLREALHKSPKDRQMVLDLEKKMKAFISDQKRDCLHFPPMSSYDRMVVHRCAAIFGLAHNINTGGNRVVVTKTSYSKIPSTDFCSLIENDNYTQKYSSVRRSGASLDTVLNSAGCDELASEPQRAQSFEVEQSAANRPISLSPVQQASIAGQRENIIPQHENIIPTPSYNYQWMPSMVPTVVSEVEPQQFPPIGTFSSPEEEESLNQSMANIALVPQFLPQQCFWASYVAPIYTTPAFYVPTPVQAYSLPQTIPFMQIGTQVAQFSVDAGYGSYHDPGYPALSQSAEPYIEAPSDPNHAG